MADSISVIISALVFSCFLLATIFSFNVKKLAKGSRRLMWTILPIAGILFTLSSFIGAFAATGYMNIFIYEATKKISIIIAGFFLFLFFKEISEVF